MEYGVWGTVWVIIVIIIFEGTYEIDELDQAWLQLVNEKRKYKSKAYTCNATTIALSLSLSFCVSLSSFLLSLPLLQY